MPAISPKRQSIHAARRNARLEARVPQETKDVLERAAAVQGRKMSDFVISSALEAAHRILRESELADLTKRDRLAFVEALLNPPAPNERLRKAVARHAQVFGR
ncbi:type II toxin-antitoxin system TacA family antitoxin [Occallatibacter riparius]|uniref:DUF1778 domain-containing protein n=1 Tax=Occallatibacter riparius TaxID=1002689 RepID=A0A9J7BJ48_9BACT|nr:DUF1778 domain-containing protein [Occallatibacter riparius]UWZ82539.1 DUF1778 domain-containing protein [Occallatibacter riparius]